MTDESTIYVVMGATGEYSDHIEWTVIAYEDESAAMDHVCHAEKRAHEIAVRDPHGPDHDAKNEWDPGMGTSYTGTRYYVITVNLRDGVARNLLKPSAVEEGK